MYCRTRTRTRLTHIYTSTHTLLFAQKHKNIRTLRHSHPHTCLQILIPLLTRIPDGDCLSTQELPPPQPSHPASCSYCLYHPSSCLVQPSTNQILNAMRCRWPLLMIRHPRPTRSNGCMKRPLQPHWCWRVLVSECV